MVDILQSEDEIAFVLAHEMSHVLLRHYLVRPESRKNPIPDAPWTNQPGVGTQTEKEADGLGTYLVANAGYDPNASVDSLCSLVRVVRDFSWFTPCTLVNYSPDNTHGSVWQRASRINEILAKINYPAAPPRTISKELFNARAELQQLRDALKAKN